jgi:LmbE family N-acetylglucosaminyl deacetylase
LKHIQNGDEVFFGITSSDEYRTGDKNHRYQEQILSAGIMGVDFESIYTYSYNDEVHDIIGRLDIVKPDVVFTHHEFDTHQDHRRASIIGQAVGRKRTMTTLFYDSGSSYDFNPNTFAMIDFDKKYQLMSCYKSQIELGAINLDIIKKKNEYWATLITEEQNSYAEGFMARKMLWLE